MSLNTTHFRYGNFVNLIFEDEKIAHPCRVTEIYKKHILTDTSFKLHDRKFQYEPVKLTQQWLLDFGFKPQDNSGYFINYWTPNNFGMMMCLQTQYGFIQGEFYDGKIQKLISYVHKLQNLYFAVTDCELEFKV